MVELEPMTAIVECVPNFSEGRRREVCEAIAAEIKRVEGIKFLDLQMDYDHHRSVLSFIGAPQAVPSAALAAAAKAVELIDLNHHKGEHPRIGAVDVIPFVPIRDVEMKECVALARTLGHNIAETLKVPVYLYEEAATRPERKNLANVRRGEFEGLREEIKTNPERAPDFGTRALHPTAGAVAVGARMPLIAYNVDLETTNVKIAKDIAKKIREANDGLPGIKALGLWVAERSAAQVSMNVCDYTKTSLHTTYKTIEQEALTRGVKIRSSEVVGLLPRAALKDEWVSALKLTTFGPEQIIENRL